MRSSSKREGADVARRELIGLEVTIGSGHAGFDGLSGTVRDETMNTFLVETASGSEVRVPKAGQDFTFRVGDERIVVRGNDIQFRPEDRTKKISR
jgi:ribonuclease P protein subunit POP4